MVPVRRSDVYGDTVTAVPVRRGDVYDDTVTAVPVRRSDVYGYSDRSAVSVATKVDALVHILAAGHADSKQVREMARA